MVAVVLREAANLIRGHVCGPNESDGLITAADLIDPDVRN